MTIIEHAIESGNPNGTVSLSVLLDLLVALELEVGTLPSPAPRFAHELEQTLAVVLTEAGDGR